MPREVIQQTELGGGGRDELAIDGQSHGDRINFDLAHPHRARSQGTLKASQYSFYPRHQFSRTEWLRNVVIGSQFEPQYPIRFTAFGREKNYGDHRQRLALTN